MYKYFPRTWCHTIGILKTQNTKNVHLYPLLIGNYITGWNLSHSNHNLHTWKHNRNVGSQPCVILCHLSPHKSHVWLCHTGHHLVCPVTPAMWQSCDYSIAYVVRSTMQCKVSMMWLVLLGGRFWRWWVSSCIKQKFGQVEIFYYWKRNSFR